MKDSKRFFGRLVPPLAADKSMKSFFIELLAGIAFLVLATLVVLSFYAIHRHREVLLLEKIHTGKVTLNHFARGAVLSLVEMDFLNLNTPFKEVKDVDGFLYAFIVDHRNFIRAHTDPKQIGILPRAFEPIQSRKEGDPISETIYQSSSGTQVLNLETPILYMQKPIGRVHLGLSLDTLNKLIEGEIASFRNGLLSLSLLLILVAAGTALFLRTRLSRWALAPKEIKSERKEEGALPKEATPARQYGARGMPQRPDQEFSQITRKQVTILFGGIKGFRDYAESREPEDVLKDLNEYFSIASQSILDQGGYIDKFVGDAIIGVFESLSFQKDHAERAVQSALSMQRTLQEANRNGNPLLNRVGIGITSGIVLSGHFLSQGHEKHTFIGESFKEAYLLNLMAGPGEVTLSKDVYHLIQDIVTVDPLPPLEMNEKRAPWESFRLTHVRGSKIYA